MPGMGLTFAQNPQRGQGQVFDGINWGLAYTAQVQGLVANSLPMVSSLPGTMTDSGLTVDRSESVSLINLAHGAGPTTPINGDTWTTTTGQRNRINGATQTVAYIDLAATYSVPLLTSSSTGFGYAGSGTGGTVTQATSRTTGVTINKACGEITLFTAAGSTAATSFTVTNTAMLAATDQVTLNIKSATNKYIAMVTAKAAGSFEITFFTTGGVVSDAPVIGFSIHRAVNA